LARPEDAFDFDGDGAFIAGVERELGMAPPASRVELDGASARYARRELRWFYVTMGGRVPAVCEAPRDKVAAASRIAGWLSELQPNHRGAFVVHYDRRRWPVRLLRQFGGLTSVIVRFVTMRRWGPTETLAQAEKATVAKLLATIAAAGRPSDLASRGDLSARAAKRLRGLRRAATKYVRHAEHAYIEVRGDAPCAIAATSREGA
jgi:hypothetical protein